jgi:glycosyltransferase involved in cell wall biosynthesis
MASDTASGQVPHPDTLRTERPALPVCVVIPAYNRAHQLKRCLASVWAQRPLLPKEVIVVDDNSTDDTAEVAASLGARVISHAENRGAAEARNTALAATDCEWVAFLDSDDEWLPHHLEHLWDIKRDHALVGAASFHCTSDGAGDRFSGPVTRKPMQFHSPDRLISSYNFFTASGSMLRRDVAIAVGGFHDWWGVADFDLWVRVLERHTGTCSRRVTVRYHIHEDQMSLAKDRMLAEHREVIEAHLKRTGRNRDMLERWEATLAWDALRAALADGHRRAALRHLPSVVAGPQRLIGLVSQFWLRFRVRRRTSRVEQDGGPSIAVMVAGPAERQAVLDALRERRVHDLSSLGMSAAMLILVRRPRGLVVTASKLQAALLHLIGNRTVTVRAASDGTLNLSDWS